MDTKTHPEIVYMMVIFVKKFNGVHFNKLFDIQGRDFKNLPTLNEHMNKKNEKCILCYQKALGFFPGSNCNFCHIAGSEFPKDFVVKLCEEIRPGLKKIMDLGSLPCGTGKKRRFNRGGGADNEIST